MPSPTREHLQLGRKLAIGVLPPRIVSGSSPEAYSIGIDHGAALIAQALVDAEAHGASQQVQGRTVKFSASVTRRMDAFDYRLTLIGRAVDRLEDNATNQG